MPTRRGRGIAGNRSDYGAYRCLMSRSETGKMIASVISVGAGWHPAMQILNVQHPPAVPERRADGVGLSWFLATEQNYW